MSTRCWPTTTRQLDSNQRRPIKTTCPKRGHTNNLTKVYLRTWYLIHRPKDNVSRHNKLVLGQHVTRNQELANTCWFLQQASHRYYLYTGIHKLTNYRHLIKTGIFCTDWICYLYVELCQQVPAALSGQPTYTLSRANTTDETQMWARVHTHTKLSGNSFLWVGVSQYTPNSPNSTFLQCFCNRHYINANACIFCVWFESRPISNQI